MNVPSNVTAVPGALPPNRGCNGGADEAAKAARSRAGEPARTTHMGVVHISGCNRPGDRRAPPHYTPQRLLAPRVRTDLKASAAGVLAKKKLVGV